MQYFEKEDVVACLEQTTMFTGGQFMPDRELDGNVFPEVFCIEDIHCMRREDDRYECRAMLYHDQAGITVAFDTAEPDTALKPGCFVSVDWLATAHSEHGAVKVGGLCVRDCTASGFNPFRSVPHSWCVDRHQIECARDLWDASSRQLRKLLFATFWNGLHVRSASGGAGAYER